MFMDFVCGRLCYGIPVTVLVTTRAGDQGTEAHVSLLGIRYAGAGNHSGEGPFNLGM